MADCRAMIPRQTRRAAAFGECTRGANGIFYICGRLHGGVPRICAKSTVHDYLELWNWDGTLERIITNCTLRCASRKGEPSRQWI